jgi:hypothetical protein
MSADESALVFRDLSGDDIARAGTVDERGPSIRQMTDAVPSVC